MGEVRQAAAAIDARGHVVMAEMCRGRRVRPVDQLRLIGSGFDLDVLELIGLAEELGEQAAGQVACGAPVDQTVTGYYEIGFLSGLMLAEQRRQRESIDHTEAVGFSGRNGVVPPRRQAHRARAAALSVWRALGLPARKPGQHDREEAASGR